MLAFMLALCVQITAYTSDNCPKNRPEGHFTVFLRLQNVHVLGVSPFILRSKLRADEIWVHLIFNYLVCTNINCIV